MLFSRRGRRGNRRDRRVLLLRKEAWHAAFYAESPKRRIENGPSFFDSAQEDRSGGLDQFVAVNKIWSYSIENKCFYLSADYHVQKKKSDTTDDCYYSKSD